MQRRRGMSLPEHLLVREKALAELNEYHDDLHGAIGTIKEEDEEIEKKANSKDEGNEDRETPFLHKVVSEGNIELLSKLIKSGTDINVCDKEGWPPLNTAIRLGQTKCAALLLKHGAGEFLFERQKDQYIERLQKSKRKRRITH